MDGLTLEQAVINIETALADIRTDKRGHLILEASVNLIKKELKILRLK